MTKNDPFFNRNCDHHPPVCSRNFIGDIIAGHLVFDGFGAMNAAKRGLDDRKDHVRYKGDTKPKDSRSGIAEGVYFRIQIRGKFLKSGLDRPAASI